MTFLRLAAALLATLLALSFGASAEPAMQLQASAKVGSSIVVAGMYNFEAPWVKVGKLLADGNMDTSFGSGGWATHLAPGVTHVTAVTVQPDGKVVVALKANPDNLWLLRLNADGTPDEMFGNHYEISPSIVSAGFYAYPTPNTQIRINALHIEATGHILGLGSYQANALAHVALMRFTPGGRPDLSFAGGPADGVRMFQLPGLDSAINEFTVDSDGGLVAVGYRKRDDILRNEWLAIKFKDNGYSWMLDSTWGSSSGWNTYLWNDGGEGQAAYQVARDSLGRFLVAGASDGASATNLRMGSMRLLANGQIDSTYHWNTIIEAGYQSQYNYVAFPAGIFEVSGDAFIAGTAFERHVPNNSLFAHYPMELDSLEPYRWGNDALVLYRPTGSSDQFALKSAFLSSDTGYFITLGTRESAGTSYFHRARFFTNYQPWLLDGGFDTDFSQGAIDAIANPIDLGCGPGVGCGPGIIPKKGEFVGPLNSFRVAGISVPVQMTIANGELADVVTWQFSGAPRTANNGDVFQLRLQSSTTPDTTVTATLTVAGVSQTFSVLSGNVPPVSITQSPASNTAAPATFKFQNYAWNPYDATTYECSLDGAAYVPCQGSGTVYSTLSLGEHTFQVRGTNSWGTGTPASYTWTVIGVPETSITSGPAVTGNPPTTAVFTFTSDSPTATFQCKLDAEAYASCTSPWTRTNLAMTSHTFSVRAVNSAGVDATPSSHTWTIDGTAPNTTITTGLHAWYGVPRIKTAFTSDDPTATFECKLDGGAYEACVSPKLYENVADGTHTVYVRAKDPAGNIDPTPATRTVKIDTAPPETTFTQTPAATVSSVSVTYYIQSTAYLPDYQTLIECTLDGQVQNSINCSGQPLYTSGDGAHNFSARAYKRTNDENGVSMYLFDPTPATHSFVVDLPPPDTFISTSSPTGTITTSTAVFNFWADPYTGGMFECSFDGAAFTACSPDMTYSNLADGPHTFAVRARTATKTDPTPATRSFTVAVTTPDTTITSGPLNYATTTSLSFGFSASLPGSTFECSLDGAPYTACTSLTSYSGLSQGSHTFSVRAKKDDRTDLTPATRTFVVDTMVPIVTISSGPYPITSLPFAIFHFSANESGVTFTCSINGAPAAACTSPFNGGPATTGPHTFRVYATDAAGNATPAPTLWNWTVDPNYTPQTFIDSGPSGPTAQTTNVFTFHSDRPGSTFECLVNSGVFTACTTPISVSLPDGSHMFSVLAIDAEGNRDASPVTAFFSIDTVAPVVSITAGPSGTLASTSANFSFTATEGTVECRLDGVAFAPCAGGSKSYSGLAPGAHTFDVRSTDPAGNQDVESRSWTVDTTVPTTTITSGPANNTTADTATFVFSSNEPAATFECRLDGSAWVACSSPANYTGIAKGNHTFEVRARDGAGNTDATPASHTWRRR